MNNIAYKQSKSLSGISGIRHGFFTKRGGVSKGIYDSLNCGPSSSDDLENVIENRWRALVSLGLQESTLFGLKQIHSTVVHIVDKKTKDDFFEGDALVTSDPGVSLSVLGADCAPLLFADNEAKVIAAAHAGWKGAVSGMVEAVVKTMCEQGASRSNIHACIGPAIEAQSYEVRDDFIQQLNRIGHSTDKFILNKPGKYYFDLPGYLLEQCLHSEINTEKLGLDTYSLKNDFFSFRRNTHENIKEYGRQVSIIGLL